MRGERQHAAVASFRCVFEQSGSSAGAVHMSAPQDSAHARRVAAASLVSGAASGVMGVATGYPLETLRVRMQTQAGHRDFRGPLDCLFKTVRGEGLLGLYKGMASPLLGATVTKTVNFGAFGFLLASLRDSGTTEARPLHIVCAGAASAVLASLVLTPVDRAKILLQVQRSREERARAESRPVTPVAGEERLYRGPRDVWREQGRGMWRGQGVTSLREAVYGSLYFSVFEKLKQVCFSVGILPLLTLLRVQGSDCVSSLLF